MAVVIGEGGSGGALALSVADRLLMQEHAIYSVTSPEGAAAILYRDRDRAPEVADHLGITAADLRKLRVVDVIVPEPSGGAHTNPSIAATMLQQEIKRALIAAMQGKGAARRRKREKRLRRLGRSRLDAFRGAADLLSGVSEIAVHALDLGRRRVEERIRGADRAAGSKADED